MITHNSYFDGKVQSVGFERHGRRQSVGVVDTGEYAFNTDAAERMTVVSGELEIRVEGASEFRTYAAGTSFEVPAHSGFAVRAATPTAYVCEFL